MESGTRTWSTAYLWSKIGHGFEPFWHHPGPPGECRGEQPQASLQGLRQKKSGEGGYKYETKVVGNGSGYCLFILMKSEKLKM